MECLFFINYIKFINIIYTLMNFVHTRQDTAFLINLNWFFQ